MILAAVALAAADLSAAWKRPAFCMPDTLYAAPGIECNVYFGSAFDTDSFRAYSFDVEGKVGRCLNDRWTWTPTPGDAGTRHRLVFNAWSDFAACVSRTVSVVVAKSAADKSRKVTFALLGDSLTNARYQDRILAVMREAGWSQFTPVGSRSGSSAELPGVYRDGEAAHDGYGGFSPGAFLSRYALAVDEVDNVQSEAEKEQLLAFGVEIPPGKEWMRGILKSPFVRFEGGSKKVDVQAWLDRVNGGLPPDFVFIELGVNGDYGRTEASAEKHCELVQVPDMRRLIAAVREVAPQAKIALGSCVVGADQDAHGRNYGCAISAVSSRRAIFHVSACWERLVKELNDAGDRNVFFIPFGCAIDPVNGYIRTTEPAFVHSDVNVVRITNALHPCLAGGRQLGDAVGSFLLAKLAEGDGDGFDTASAWVAGVKFAWGANRDRTTPPPRLTVRFRTASGATNVYSLGDVDFKNRHYLQRRFSGKELAELKGSTCLGFAFEGLTDEDKGVSFSDARLFREELPPIPAVTRAKRNLVPMKNQNLGNNTGPGTLPFPVREKTVQPAAASAKPPLAVVPRFTGGAVRPGEARYLDVRERREGRVLVVDLSAPAGKVTEINLGLAGEARRERLVRVPYLPNFGEVELLDGGLFRFACLDWYRSNASEVRTNSDHSVSVVYLPKTDGTYNDVCERVVIALSDEFADVLPEIPNPPSPFKRLVGERLWRSHAASNRARDRAFWRFMHDNGIRKVCVMDHETMWRDGGEAFTMTTSAAAGRGGDRAQMEYTRFMIDGLGYVYGPYNNYTDYQPNNDRWWSVDRVARRSDGSLVGAWLRSYTPKATAILPICEDVASEAQRKFSFHGAYCDVHTAVHPWRKVDYDARCPGAGTFSQVFYAWGELLLMQRRLWQGPVWSEGGNHFMFAGLADGNYASDYWYDFAAMPWLVDFDLLKIHPLECDFGMGSLSMFSHPATIAERDFYLPGMPEGRDRLVDSFIAATLAFGHNGLLIADWCWKPAKMFGPAYCGPSEETFKDGLAIARRSYFMTQAIAARYSQEKAVEIRYFDGDGRACGTSEALVSGAIGLRHVYVRYSGGTHVAVNGNPRERMKARVAGVEVDLPPYGYRCWTDDGEVFVRADDSGGNGRRRYFARSPEYVYDGGAEGAASLRCRLPGAK
ncbi:MAG: SGNH/GDSL hydrolase family protein [Kiritimatiellae bacterium]|nr:SGNH/GDSL hydrolase family protein [Kiritimatiellia bacterium]